jgi:hypothetical protein
VSVIWEMTTKEDAAPVASLLTLLKSKQNSAEDTEGEKSALSSPVPCVAAAKAG